MFKELNALDFIRAGISGLVFLLLYLGYHLLKHAITTKGITEAQLKAVRFYLITCLISAVIAGGFDLWKLFLNPDTTVRQKVQIRGVYLLQEPTNLQSPPIIELRTNSSYSYSASQMVYAIVFVSQAATNRDGSIDLSLSGSLVNSGSGLGQFMQGNIQGRPVKDFHKEWVTNQFSTQLDSLSKRLTGSPGIPGFIFSCRAPPLMGTGAYVLTVIIHDRVTGYADASSVALEFATGR
jgi:hypothetical protein